MSTFPCLTNRPARAKKISAAAFFRVGRSIRPGEPVPRPRARCDIHQWDDRDVPVQAGPQGPHLLPERRGGRRVTRQGRSVAENVRSALTRRPSRSYPPRVESADPGSARPARVSGGPGSASSRGRGRCARRRVGIHGPTLANGGDASWPADGDGRFFPFQDGRIQPGATRPAGVTEEHLLGQQTAGLLGVAPGFTPDPFPDPGCGLWLCPGPMESTRWRGEDVIGV